MVALVGCVLVHTYTPVKVGQLGGPHPQLQINLDVQHWEVK